MTSWQEKKKITSELLLQSAEEYFHEVYEKYAIYIFCLNTVLGKFVNREGLNNILCGRRRKNPDAQMFLLCFLKNTFTTNWYVAGALSF